MPWQQLVADVGLEYDPDSKLPFYREIVVTVPRQSGKTTLCLSWEVDRALNWGRQHVAYTAQTGLDARGKLVKDQVPMLMQSPLRVTVDQVLRGNSYTAIEFKNGSRVEALPTSESAGHGKTLALGVIDEAFADEDDRREQGLGPAMITVADAQKLVISTAGTEKSTFLRRKVETGRAAVADGVTEGIAYFEWSAPDDADADDPEVWRSCMPALGHTVTERSVAAERASMSDGEFRRAYLNQWTLSDDRVIPAHVWGRVLNDKAVPTGSLVFGVDVNPERTAASIGVCDADGTVEVVHYGVVSGVVDRVVGLAQKHSAPVVLDAGGPAGPLIPNIAAEGVVVLEYNGRDLANACGRFFDLVADQKITVRPRDVLESAVSGATRRLVGDAWAWGRRQSTVDISPLVAVTLAVDAAVKPDLNVADPGLLVYTLD